MKFLVTNDDGIDAEGLAVLTSAASDLGETYVVAPAGPQSGVSHAVTTGRSVRIDERGPQRVAVHGTPADCVRIGLNRLVTDATFILSGVNHGGNLGADVYHSGTVAAVREGVMHGWPGIAFSHYRKKDRDFAWDRIARWLPRVLQELLVRPVEPGLFYSVNFPHLEPHEEDPSIVYCPLDPSPLPLSYQHGDEGLLYDGNYHLRRRVIGADIDCCFTGRIAVTPLRLF